MYHRWLDRWDERRAQRGDPIKVPVAFALDADLAFPGANPETTKADFWRLADKELTDPMFFGEATCSEVRAVRQGDLISFPSEIVTATTENNRVWARVTEAKTRDAALVVFHHWNASRRNDQIARFFSKRGITVVEMALPYHFERSRPGSSYADHMLNSNLGQTIQSMRQAVLDGRKLIRWLRQQGYSQVSVFGMSLGSWVAGLIAAHDPAVSKAALFLTAGSLADMVWTGRATRHIRAGLEGEIDLPDLRRAWGPLNLENHATRLAREDLDLQIVLAKRDNVVLPDISHQFLSVLERAGSKPLVHELDCGHYSLSLPPYILVAGLSVLRLLSGGSVVLATKGKPAGTRNQ